MNYLYNFGRMRRAVGWEGGYSEWRKQNYYAIEIINDVLWEIWRDCFLLINGFAKSRYCMWKFNWFVFGDKSGIKWMLTLFDKIVGEFVFKVNVFWQSCILIEIIYMMIFVSNLFQITYASSACINFKVNWPEFDDFFF